MTDTYAIIIRAMLNDEDFLNGGIFSKEAYYMKKYNLTEDEMCRITARVFWALRPKETVREYNVN